ncbi:MAG: DNA repair protein RecO [Alphaproteobacteria bacterium]
MQWVDDAFVLSLERYGERSFIMTTLTHQHGLRRGLVRQAVRYGKPYGITERVRVLWRARHEERLGTFQVESLRNPPLAIFTHDMAPILLRGVIDLIRGFCSESESFPQLFEGVDGLLLAMDQELLWRSTYLRFELLLLGQIGYALDLEKCSVTNSKSELLYISPRTGHAVSRSVAKGYESRLLPLLPTLIDPSMVKTNDDLHKALMVTGHFVRKVAQSMDISAYLQSRQLFVQKLSGNNEGNT